MSNLMKSVSAAALGLLLVSCTPYQDRVDPAAVAAEEMAIEARTFVAKVETELAAMNRQAAQAYWNQATNITPETNAALEKFREELFRLLEDHGLNLYDE